MFIAALVGSAFSRISSSSAKEVIPAYYHDDLWATCRTTSIEDGDCIVDDVGNLCYEFVFDYGRYTLLYQNGTPSSCYQPFYRYP